MSHSGFSLIELLVVVVIIGILSSIGIIGYQSYITVTKDEVGKANSEQLNNMLFYDHTSITNGLSGRSDVNASTNTETRCKDQADKIIHEMNTVQGRTNPHDENCGFAFNGNRAWSSANYEDGTNNVNYFTNCPVTVTATTISVPRGRMMIACVNNTAKVDSAEYKLYTCYCSGEENCITTDVSDNCTSSPYLDFGSEDNCRVKWMTHVDNAEKCPSPGAFN